MTLKLATNKFVHLATIIVVHLVIFLLTMPRNLSWGAYGNASDGGELITAVNYLGVPHPPGYPIYMILLKIFTSIIPFGNLALKSNLFSILTSIAAICIVFLFTLKLAEKIYPEFSKSLKLTVCSIGSFVIGTSPLFWSQSIIAEVYSLNALFVSLILLISYKIMDFTNLKPYKMTLFFWGLIAGLSLGNHLTIIAIIVPLFCIFIKQFKLDLKKYTYIAYGTIAGLISYIYIPIRAAQNPPINWGGADTFDGFIWLITAAPYREYVLGVDQSLLFSRLLQYTQILFVQFNPLGIFLCIIGGLAIYRKEPKLFFPLTFSTIILSIYSLAYNSVDFEVLMLPALMIISIGISIGFLHILYLIKTTTLIEQRYLNILSMAIFSLAIIMILPAFSIYSNFKSLNQTQINPAISYIDEMIENIPPKSVILANTDKEVFSLWYAQYILNPEHDIKVIALPLMQYDWYRSQIKLLFPNNIPEISEYDLSNNVYDIVEYNNSNGVVVYTTTYNAHWDPKLLTEIIINAKLYELILNPK